MNALEARSRVKECLRQALNASSIAETVKWLREAEDWMKRGSELERGRDCDGPPRSLAS
jgi:hypothetical protein